MKQVSTVETKSHVLMFHLKWITWYASVEMKQSICFPCRLVPKYGSVQHQLRESMVLEINIMGVAHIVR